MSEGKKLVSCGGNGYGYSNEDGKFEVKHKGGTKKFAKLSEAISFYEGLDEESAIWDVTSIPELLDARVYEK
jgi:hypothetical protein